MSWQTYVDDHLMCEIESTGHHLTAAAIIGHDGSVWAQSSAFPQVYISLFHCIITMYKCCLLSLLCLVSETETDQFFWWFFFRLSLKRTLISWKILMNLDILLLQACTLQESSTWWSRESRELSSAERR